MVVAFITDPPVVKRILEHLGLPTTLPRMSPATSALAEQRELDLLDEPPAEPVNDFETLASVIY
ncbi:MAG: hypothetical protein GY856_44330 [bacterium]|nr:hypothetical protein [bacterium]